MRVLGVGDELNLGSMYLKLIADGHDVIVFAGDEPVPSTLAGLVPTTQDWRSRLDWVRAAGNDGIIVFETSSFGDAQDELRADGFQVVGGCAYGDRLETDRAFGQSVMRDVGMRVAPTHAFDSFDDAKNFVLRNPDRYVYKPSGKGFASGRTYIGELDDSADLLAYLDLQRQTWPKDERERFVLMQRLRGVEVGVGAYFDGGKFLEPACLDWEHKRFFAGDLGEMTGEMGTVVTYRQSGRLFAETLGRMTEPLRQGGYRGYININTIVDESGVHPLEFTCRFGYPGFAILQPLQICGWEEILRRMATPCPETHFATQGGFAVGVVLTVPPFPYREGYQRLSLGLPIVFRSDMTDEDRAHLHYCEVAAVGGRLLTAGSIGYLMVVTGVSDTIADARSIAYARIRKVCVPNGRYRIDIGGRLVETDYQRLMSWGWLGRDERVE